MENHGSEFAEYLTFTFDTYMHIVNVGILSRSPTDRNDANFKPEGDRVSTSWVLRIMEPSRVHADQVEGFGDYAAERAFRGYVPHCPIRFWPNRS